MAFGWLKNGIPQKGEAVSYKKYTLRNIAKEADITQGDTEIYLPRTPVPGFSKIRWLATHCSYQKLKDAIVCSVEFGTSIITQETPLNI